MSNLNHTHISLVIDQSGSMEGHRKVVCQGFQNFLVQQQKLASECSLNVTFFNSRITEFLTQEPIKSAKGIESDYHPDGGTSLYDAIGTEVQRLTAYLATKPFEEYPSKIIVIVLTDGYENTSNIFTQQKIKELVQTMEDDYNWDFLFIATNQDAVKVGQQLGFKSGKALTYTSSNQGVLTVFEQVSNAVSSYRLNGAPADDNFFSEADRQRQSNLR